MSVGLPILQARELRDHVRLDFFLHRLEFRNTVQRLQGQIMLEVIPPIYSPALLDGLPQNSDRLLWFAAQCMKPGISR